MKIKNIISFALIIAVLLLSLSGCDSDKKSNSDSEKSKNSTDNVSDIVSSGEENEKTYRGKIDSFSVSDDFIVALKADGTAGAVGGNTLTTSLDVSDWKDVIAVSAGANHILGLKSDGTAVTAGYGGKGQRSVADWSDVIAIHAGLHQSFGLKSDGTIIMTTEYGRSATLDGWTDIVSIFGVGDRLWGLNSNGDVYMRTKDKPVYSEVKNIYPNAYYAIFLKEDGSLVADPYSEDYKQNYTGIETWTDIVDVSARNSNFVVGLRSDGTVLATGTNTDGRCNVSQWTDIVAIATGSYHTVGLRSDGTVVATGGNGYGQCDVSEWKDIVAVYASGTLTVGLKEDGTLVAAGVVWNGLDGIEKISNVAIK